jgi:FixJ family two-component response regulator
MRPTPTRIAVADARVAIVEDDATVRRALARVLYAARFQVTSFGSAEDFLDHGLQPPPDCVLMDIHLPVMSGLDLQVRVAEAQPGIPVIFITADHELAAAGHRREGCVWLTKPIDRDTLLRAIVRSCGGDRTLAKPPLQ